LAGIAAVGTASGPIELNSAHFHPEIVSLPQCLIPVNIAPPAPGGANDVWRSEDTRPVRSTFQCADFFAANCPFI